MGAGGVQILDSGLNLDWIAGGINQLVEITERIIIFRKYTKWHHMARF